VPTLRCGSNTRHLHILYIMAHVHCLRAAGQTQVIQRYFDQIKRTGNRICAFEITIHCTSIIIKHHHQASPSSNIIKQHHKQTHPLHEHHHEASPSSITIKQHHKQSCHDEFLRLTYIHNDLVPSCNFLSIHYIYCTFVSEPTYNAGLCLRP